MNIINLLKQYRILLILIMLIGLIGMSSHYAYNKYEDYYTNIPTFCPRDDYPQKTSIFKTNSTLAKKEVTKYFLKSYYTFRRCLAVRGNTDLPKHTVPSIINCNHSLKESINNATLKTRMQMEIFCPPGSSDAFTVLREVPFDQELYTVRTSAQQRCLKRYILQHCYDGRPVPDVIHLVQFSLEGSHYGLDFRHFLGLYSILTVAKPRLVILHGNVNYVGSLWQIILRLATNVIRVHKEPQTHVRMFTRSIPIKNIANMADIARIEVLLEYGGIYLDTDVVVIKKMDIFREVQLAAAKEGNMKQLTNAVLISRPGNCLLKEWLANWRTYDGVSWLSHSIDVLTGMGKSNPQFMQSLEPVFARYGYNYVKYLYRSHCSLEGSFGAHLYNKFYPVSKISNFDYIKTVSTTFGRLARFVMFGDPNVCKVK